MCDDVQAESLPHAEYADTSFGKSGSLCYEIKSLQKEKKEKKNLPPAGDVISGRFFSAVFVLRVTLSLRQRKRLWLC